MVDDRSVEDLLHLFSHIDFAEEEDQHRSRNADCRIPIVSDLSYALLLDSFDVQRYDLQPGNDQTDPRFILHQDF